MGERGLEGTQQVIYSIPLPRGSISQTNTDSCLSNLVLKTQPNSSFPQPPQAVHPSTEPFSSLERFPLLQGVTADIANHQISPSYIRNVGGSTTCICICVSVSLSLCYFSRSLTKHADNRKIILLKNTEVFSRGSASIHKVREKSAQVLLVSSSKILHFSDLPNAKLK